MSSTPHRIPWRERAALRMNEAADVLGVSYRTVGRMIEAGTLESRRTGCITLVLTRSILEWVGEVEPYVQKPQGRRLNPATVRAAGRWMRGDRS